MGATASPEALYVWDVANLQTPILGATPAPTLLHAIDVPGCVVASAMDMDDRRQPSFVCLIG